MLSHCLGKDHKSCVKDFGWAFKTKKDKYNVYTIRKAGAKYYIFSNGHFCERANFYSLPGNTITLGADDASTVAFDFIRIYYYN